MILLLWGLLFVISIVFLVLGYTLKDTSISDVLIPTCWVFLFLLSVGVLFNQLEIPTGETETINYQYQTIDNSTFLNQSVATTQTIYTAYENELGFWKILGARTFGLFMALLSGFGFAIFWLEIKSRGEM